MADQDCAASQDNCQNSKTPVADSRFKRPRSTPTLCTPYREEKRIPLRELVCTDTSQRGCKADFVVPSTFRDSQLR